MGGVDVNCWGKYSKWADGYRKGLRKHLSHLIYTEATFKNMVSKVLHWDCPFEYVESNCSKCKDHGHCNGICWTESESYAHNGWVYACHKPDSILACDTLHELVAWRRRESKKVLRRRYDTRRNGRKC